MSQKRSIGNARAREPKRRRIDAIEFVKVLNRIAAFTGRSGPEKSRTQGSTLVRATLGYLDREHRFG
ncbi:MAG: hypothetical protein ACMG6H_04965 [Acidobacteriota bacterium]